MWKPKLRTVCCLVLLCANTSSLVRSSMHPKDHGRHQVISETLDTREIAYYEDIKDNEISAHVRGRSSVTQDSNDLQAKNEVDDFIESLHRSENIVSGDSHNSKRWSKGPSFSDNNDNRNVNGNRNGEIEQFLESFYVKFLRIEMQKSQILHSFPPDELPTAILGERDGVSNEDMGNNNFYNSSGDEGEDHDDQEMINWVKQVGSSIEQNDYDQVQASNALNEAIENPGLDGWLESFRPIYRFIRDHMERFEKELREHKRKIERVWKMEQEERNANAREDGDEPYDVSDFEHEAEKREIIFLDEVDCDHVFKGYYPSSPPTLKEYLDFCLQIDRNKFRPMVESSTNHTETNSVSELPQLQIQKAELWFYKSNADAMDSHKQMFSLTSIDNWDVEGKYKKFETISLKQSPTAIGWISADVSSPLIDWLSPMAFATLHKTNRKRYTAAHKKRNLDAYFMWKKNFGLTSKHKFFLNVSCKTCVGGGSSITSQEDGKKSPLSSNEGTHRPFFLIDYKRIDRSKHGKKSKVRDPLGESRNRRDRRNLNCAKNMKDCCREQLWVDFKDNGMDFIINPKGYHANFCRGDCDTAADNAIRSAHNSRLYTYIRSKPSMARRLGIKSCCSATEYKSIDVMYLNKNNSISNKTISNLIVESCGCN